MMRKIRTTTMYLRKRSRKSVPAGVRARRRSPRHRLSRLNCLKTIIAHLIITKPSSSVVTLNSMQDSSSDDDEEQGQAFYAGGSERSGQQVLGPPTKKNPIKDYVSEIFRSAQESGAEVVDPHTRAAAQAGSSRGAGGSVYAGAGYRLGMTDNDHTVLPSAAPPTRERPQAIEPIIIKLWSNGLSINDGPLRPYEEPENQAFLNSIKKG